jgi:hypothetical protein
MLHLRLTFADVCCTCRWGAVQALLRRLQTERQKSNAANITSGASRGFGVL